MRALASSLLLASACLSAPTGIDPGDVDAPPGGGTWPPSGADLGAMAAGDVTGDGRDDLVAVDVGRTRIYLLEGGRDFGTATSSVATRFSRERLLVDLRSPVAAAILDRMIVVLDNPARGPRLTVLDSALTVTGTVSMGGPPVATGARVWLRAAPFGASQASMFAAVPGVVGFVERDDLELATPPFKPAMGRTFATPVLAGGYVPGAGLPKVFVADERTVARADAAGASWTWSTPRDAEAWLAQTWADVGGDAAPEIVGFDVAGEGSRVCAVDVGASTVATCQATPYMMDTATVIEVAEVNAAGQDDLVLLHRGGNGASVFILPRLRLSGGAVAADNPGGPTNRSVTDPMLTIFQLQPGGPPEILLTGSGGEMACLRANGNTATDCTP